MSVSTGRCSGFDAVAFVTGWRCQCRGALCKLAAWGPLAGSAVSMVFVLTGIALTMAGQGSTEVQTSAFEDSFLVGGLGTAHDLQLLKPPPPPPPLWRSSKGAYI